MIGKIRRVPLREVWKHEAHDFTRWLEENIDVLNDVIVPNLTILEREKAAGSFSVDLFAEDADGSPVVIENQLGKSDHDHLGKLITYLTAFDAKSAVWIVTEPRPEHVTAITWLNESSSASFYLLKVEAIQIGDSTPAPLLTLIVGPSEEGRQIGKTKKEMAERNVIKYRSWESLLDRAKKKTALHTGISPCDMSWIGTGAGKSGLTYNYVASQHSTRIDLYVRRGKDTERENKKIFEELSEHREEIEKQFGPGLIWDKLETRSTCRVMQQFELGGLSDPEEAWPKIHAAMIDGMIRLEKALAPHIKKLSI